AAARSLVVVLPLLPVTATTRAPSRCRYQWANRCKAARGWSTWMTAPHNPTGSGRPRSRRVPAAPRLMAAGIKSCPSKFGPARGTNNSPACTVRLSVETPRTRDLGSPDRRVPPAARATVSRDSGSIAKPLLQRVGRFLAIVKMHGAVLEHLGRLVALAGDEHNVTGPGHVDGRPDGLPA